MADEQNPGLEWGTIWLDRYNRLKSNFTINATNLVVADFLSATDIDGKSISGFGLARDIDIGKYISKLETVANSERLRSALLKLPSVSAGAKLCL